MQNNSDSRSRSRHIATPHQTDDSRGSTAYLNAHLRACPVKFDCEKTSQGDNSWWLKCAPNSSVPGFQIETPTSRESCRNLLTCPHRCQFALALPRRGCIDFSVEAIWRTRVGESHLRVFARAELVRRNRSSWVVNTIKRAVFVSPGTGEPEDIEKRRNDDSAAPVIHGHSRHAEFPGKSGNHHASRNR